MELLGKFKSAASSLGPEVWGWEGKAREIATVSPHKPTKNFLSLLNPCGSRLSELDVPGGPSPRWKS